MPTGIDLIRFDQQRCSRITPRGKENRAANVPPLAMGEHPNGRSIPRSDHSHRAATVCFHLPYRKTFSPSAARLVQVKRIVHHLQSPLAELLRHDATDFDVGCRDVGDGNARIAKGLEHGGRHAAVTAHANPSNAHLGQTDFDGNLAGAQLLDRLVGGDLHIGQIMVIHRE